MNRALFQTLHGWPKEYITDTDLSVIIGSTTAARYGLVNRAIKEGLLLRIRRGIYLIASSNKKHLVNSFELSQIIYGPSFISLESALQYHQLIPEGIYSTMSVTVKRSCEFLTPLGIFSYEKVPITHFLLGVELVTTESTCFFMATRWRAIADLIYLRKKNWRSFHGMCDDMRIEGDFFTEPEKSLLAELATKYPNKRTRESLTRLRLQ